jgi:hypothetical protein
MFIATWASLVFSPGGATSILSDVAPDGAWTDYFLVSINIPPLWGSPLQNSLAPVILKDHQRRAKFTLPPHGDSGIGVKRTS